MTDIYVQLYHVAWAQVGAVAAFLAMPAASHIVGDVLHVNGGMLFGA